MMNTFKGKNAGENKLHVQLELALDGTCFQPRPRLSAGRMARARWWFREMHRAVEAALDWGRRPQGRPEQGRLDFSAGFGEPLPWSYSNSNGR